MRRAASAALPSPRPPEPPSRDRLYRCQRQIRSRERASGRGDSRRLALRPPPGGNLVRESPARETSKVALARHASAMPPGSHPRFPCEVPSSRRPRHPLAVLRHPPELGTARSPTKYERIECPWVSHRGVVCGRACFLPMPCWRTGGHDGQLPARVWQSSTMFFCPPHGRFAVPHSSPFLFLLSCGRVGILSPSRTVRGSWMAYPCSSAVPLLQPSL